MTCSRTPSREKKKETNRETKTKEAARANVHPIDRFLPAGRVRQKKNISSTRTTLPVARSAWGPRDECVGPAARRQPTRGVHGHGCSTGGEGPPRGCSFCPAFAVGCDPGPAASARASSSSERVPARHRLQSRDHARRFTLDPYTRLHY